MAVIRMSGHPGAGKTVLATRLARELGYTYFYVGGLFRELAKERGIAIEDFYRDLANDPTLERSIDAQAERLMQQNDRLIVEGRVAPFQKSSFKTINVFLKISPEEGARRQSLRAENAGKTIPEIERLTKERVANERTHYKQLHGITDHFDESKFDIVLDTTKTTPEEAFQIVLDKLRKMGV
jgi:cytidylate kinase